jgi:hypothetical protein
MPTAALAATLVPVEADPPVLAVDAFAPSIADLVLVEESPEFTPADPQPASLDTAPAAPPAAEPVDELTTDAVESAGDAHAESQAPPSFFPNPRGLLANLESLRMECDAHDWASVTHEELQSLCAATSPGVAAESLERLRELAKEAIPPSSTAAAATLTRRAQWALERRLDIWQAVLLAQLEEAKTPDRQLADRVLAALERVEDDLQTSPNGQGWRGYFDLEGLQALAASPQPSAKDIRRTTTRLFRRTQSTSLNVQQRRFLKLTSWVDLRRALQTWSADQLSAHELLTAIERYEETGSAADGRAVAEQSRRLFWSRDPHLRSLGERLEQRFRNANLRVTLREDFANRMLPEQPATSAPVYDMVLGVPTRGSSVTATDVSVRFVPDASQIRTVFEIKGLVDSSTRSTSGPASFQSRSHSDFTATKPVALGVGGLQFAPSEVSVDTQLRLLSLDTDYDNIPLVGSIVRNMATSQHAESQPQARAEIRRKVADKSMRQIDEQTELRLNNLIERARNRVWGPLTGMGLTPRPVQLTTEPERALARLRVADAGQLAAHTPRPQAPSNSLASVQVHESTLNNVFEKLALDGREFTVPELQQYLAEQLRLPEWKPGEPPQEDVLLVFAERDPVRVRFKDGLVEIRISFAEFIRGRSGWQDFTALVRYRPSLEGMKAQLAREGIIELIGADLSSRDRLQLQPVFNKVFTRSKPIAVLGERLAADPRLKGVEVNQFLAEEGWLALAISEQAKGPNTARRRGQTAR